MQQSATDACDRFPGLFTDCLTANDDDHTLCADSLFRYQECHNYTSVVSGTDECFFIFV